jgi:hypothetical protein
MADAMDKLIAKQLEAAAKALHAYELENGYITREWNAEDEVVYREMAKVALDAAADVIISHNNKMPLSVTYR